MVLIKIRKLWRPLRADTHGPSPPGPVFRQQIVQILPPNIAVVIKVAKLSPKMVVGSNPSYARMFFDFNF